MTTHKAAVERTIEAGALAEDQRYAAVVQLARTLAEQCDAAGPDGPSTRLSAAYLSVLKDLGRGIAAGPVKNNPNSTLGRLRSQGQRHLHAVDGS